VTLRGIYILPLRFYGAVFALRHAAIGWHRAVFKVPRDAKVSELKRQGRAVEALAKSCHICGYALAHVPSRQGWNVEGCSATAVRILLQSSGLQTWSESLPEPEIDVERPRDRDLQTCAQ